MKKQRQRKRPSGSVRKEEDAPKTKQQWLRNLRRATTFDTLFILADHISHRLSGPELSVFMGAVDHREAEILMGRHFDRVPAHVWRLIR